ncbi:MAG: helix-turn-helix domain-containing protein [Bacteroidota bacterium]
MDLGLQLLFFFSALGVFNGFLMSFYFLFIAKPSRIQNRYLGLMILMLSLRIGKSVWYYFDNSISKNILQIGLSACAFIGPFLYFYLRSVLKGEENFQKEVRITLSILLGGILTVGFFFPYISMPEYWNPEITQGIYAVWAIFIGFAAYEIRGLIQKLFSSDAPLSLQEKWLLVVFFTNLLICLVFHSILYLGFPSYIFGPITFSFVFYILLGFLLFFPKGQDIVKGERKAYQKKKIASDKLTGIKKGLRELMEEQRLFTQADLKLEELARQLSLSPHTLSQFLNEHLGKGFSDFVNEYRVEAACKLLQEEHKYTVEGIGNLVGFRSRSSFYAAFKKLKGSTPSQFSKALKLS